MFYRLLMYTYIKLEISSEINFNVSILVNVFFIVIFFKHVSDEPFTTELIFFNIIYIKGTKATTNLIFKFEKPRYIHKHLVCK